MSKIDQKYIDNLQKFTDALEGLVEQMKEQQKDGTSDTVNEMLKNIPDKLNIIVDNQKDIINNQKGIKKDTSEILKEIKQIKNREKTGGLSAITETDNAKKVGDAVKSIILIAGGILAIGMAFKIVGNVDFASVVALSLGILVAVEAFKKVSDMDVSVQDMVFSGLMIILMAGSLVAASFLLSKIPAMSVEQGLTLLLVAGAVGVASWLVMKGVDEINIVKDWATILLLPVFLPLIATGILLSSYILQYVQPISWQQALAIAVVGAAIGIATMFIGLAMVGMKKMTIKEALLLPVMIPLIAGGIVLASVIFQYFEPVRNPVDLLLGSLYIGAALLLMVPTIVLVGKFLGNNIQAAAIGIVALPLIALGLVATAWAFTLLPSNMIYPTLEWSLGSAISMLLFLPTMLIVGAIGMTGVGIGVLAIGLVGLPLIALSMVAVSQILTLGDWSDNYPTIDWALGVGTSLLMFGTATILAAPAALISGIFSFFGGEDPLVKLANSMLEVGEILSSGTKYWKKGNYPGPDWAGGVGGALFMFASAFATISLIEGIGSLFGGNIDFNKFVVMASNSMLTAASILALGNWEVGYPTEKWSDGVGTALFMFAKAFAVISLIEGIGSLFGGDIDFNKFVITASGAMVLSSMLLQGGLWDTGYPTKDWSEGVGLALSYFAKAFAVVSAVEGLGGIINKLFGGKDFDFNSFVVEASRSMVTASHELKKGDWTTNYPSQKYVEGVGGLLVTMAEAYKKVNAVGFMDILGSLFGVGGKKMELSDFIVTSASSLAKASLLFNTGKYDSIPEKSYMNKFANFMDTFADIISDFDGEKEEMDNFNYLLNNVLPNFGNLVDFPSMDPFVENINKFSNVIKDLPDDKHKAITRLSDSIRDFSDALKEVDMSTLDKLSTISQGVLLVSIVDEAKLRGVLDAMSEKESELKEIYGDKEKEGAFTKFTNWASNLIGGGEQEPEKSSTAVVKNERDLDKEEFYSNIAAIRSMMQNMIDMIDSPGQSGSFNK